MKVTPIILIESLIGKVNLKAGYYIRRSKNGTLFSCRCPDRSKHLKTPAEAANQQTFAAKYAGKNKKINNP